MSWMLATNEAIYLMQGGTNQYISKRELKNGVQGTIPVVSDWFKRPDPPGNFLIRPNAKPKRYNPPPNQALNKFTKGKKYLVFYWTGKKDTSGFKIFHLELHAEDSSLIDCVEMRSGTGGVQAYDFLYPTKDYSGSGEPMSEAVYEIAEDYDMVNEEPGVGFHKICLDYHPLTQPNNRSSILFHDDAGYLGSLGCGVTYPGQDTNNDGLVDWKTVRKWYKEHSLRGCVCFTWYDTGYLRKQGLTLEMLKGKQVAVKKPSGSTSKVESIQSSNQVPLCGEELCALFEGFSAEPYRCQSDIPTIGYGTTYYPDGSAVTMADPPISAEKAHEMYRQLLREKYWQPLIKNIPHIISMNQNQQGALLSFSYNAGYTRMNIGRFDTLDRAIAHNWNEIPDALTLYNKSSHGVSHGLVRRRHAEGLLFMGKSAKEAYQEAMKI